MIFTYCQIGHIFNSGEYSQCPYCAERLNNNQALTALIKDGCRIAPLVVLPPVKEARGEFVPVVPITPPVAPSLLGTFPA